LEDVVTLLDLTPRVVETSPLSTLPVAIIGAGPVGLAAASHLAERGIDFVVFEAGDDVAASVRSWGHTRLFSPWKHLVDPASRRLLEEHGWELPDPERAPTGTELVE
jgi:cation diffusion facilitator CzcD-associated flavoprotein CzcO